MKNRKNCFFSKSDLFIDCCAFGSAVKWIGILFDFLFINCYPQSSLVRIDMYYGMIWKDIVGRGKKKLKSLVQNMKK